MEGKIGSELGASYTPFSFLLCKGATSLSFRRTSGGTWELRFHSHPCCTGWLVGRRPTSPAQHGIRLSGSGWAWPYSPWEGSAPEHEWPQINSNPFTTSARALWNFSTPDRQRSHFPIQLSCTLSVWRRRATESPQRNCTARLRGHWGKDCKG